MTLFLLDLPGKKISLEDLSVIQTSQQHTFTGAVQNAYADSIGRFHADHRKRVLPQFDPDNNPILTLDRFQVASDRRALTLGRVAFKDYYALKQLLYQHPSDSRLLHQFVPLSMIVLLETGDDHLVMGHRGGEHLPDRYLSPAGFQEFQPPIDVHYFAAKCHEEIHEEVGIPFTDPISYIGLTGDSRDSFLDVCIFFAKTEQTIGDIEQAWASSGAKDEHKHLIYLPVEPKSLCSFLQGTYTGTANPFKGIVFAQGKCISGPEEIRGKHYQQIENGVGSLVAYLSLTLPREQLQLELQRLVSSRTIDGVVEKTFKDNTLPFLV